MWVIHSGTWPKGKKDEGHKERQFAMKLLVLLHLLFHSCDVPFFEGF
jgi:hypothetical protein